MNEGVFSHLSRDTMFLVYKNTFFQSAGLGCVAADWKKVF